MKGYTIGVVSRMLNISPQTIRMYEHHGLILPFRTPGNIRIYSDEDLETLKLIQRLTQEFDVNLAGVEIIVRLSHKIKQLQQEKEQLIQMLHGASELIGAFMKNAPGNPSLVRSSMDYLVKITETE